MHEKFVDNNQDYQLTEEKLLMIIENFKFDHTLISSDNFFELIFATVKHLNGEVEFHKQQLKDLYQNFTKVITSKTENFISDLQLLFSKQKTQVRKVNKNPKQKKAKKRVVSKKPIQKEKKKSTRLIKLKNSKPKKQKKRTLRINKKPPKVPKLTQSQNQQNNLSDSMSEANEELENSQDSLSVISDAISEVDLEQLSQYSQENQNEKDYDMLTQEEMKNSLFFFQKSTEALQMVHLNKDYPEIYKTEEVFSDSIDITKQRQSFTLLNTPEFKNNLTGQMEFRHLLMGLNKEMNCIYEFVKELDQEKEIYKLENQQKFLYNSSILIHEGYLYCIGGSQKQNSDIDMDTCSRFKISINQKKKMVHLEKDQKFPNLLRPRKNHSCFVFNKFLYVVFGTQDDIEYLDLTEGELKFRRIQLQNHQLFEKAMIFIDESNKQNPKILFFGGNRELIERGGTKQSLLMQINIIKRGTIEQDNENRILKNGVLSDYEIPIIFQHTPAFNQRLENKKFYKRENIWCFIDEDGGFYTLNMNTFKTSYQDASKFDNFSIKMELN
eukprot:403356013